MTKQNSKMELSRASNGIERGRSVGTPSVVQKVCKAKLCGEGTREGSCVSEMAAIKSAWHTLA